METDDNVNNTTHSSGTSERPFRNLLHEESKESEKTDDCAEFYFESDHLALKGNKDYTSLLRTIVMLETQRMRAVQDIDKILSVQKQALSDPIAFVEKLQRKEDLGIPSPQVICDLPKIEWSKYDIAFSSVPSRPNTRTSSYKPTTDIVEPDVCVKGLDGKILVRGRVFDESKPETFNQLWTAEEQRRLEELLVDFPPEEIEMRRWKKIATALGNRTPKQVQSRVQKYFIKLQRAGLPVPGRAPKLENQLKKASHRHQRNNRLLFRPSTFFPSQDPPVFMSEFDEDAGSSGTNTSQYLDNELLVKEEPDDDYSNEDGESGQDSGELAQIKMLKRVMKEKELQEKGPYIEHTGYKCDTCEEEPIIGTRWHCEDCPSSLSVDYCSDCIVSQLDTPQPHCLVHNFHPLRRREERSIWDQDYRLSQSYGGYNYLDPNFMPG